MVVISIHSVLSMFQMFQMDFLTLSIVLLFLAAAYLLYMCWHFTLFSRQGIPVNGTPLPILGNMGRVMSEGLVDGLNGDLEKYGRTHGTYVGRSPTLTTIDADLIKEVFVKEHATFSDKFSFRSGDVTEDLMLSNINDYSSWKSLRAVMTPTFSSGKLKRMIPQINKCAAVYAGHLVRESAGGKSLEMKEFAGSFTMDVIASIGFGLDVNTQEDRNNPFVTHATKAITISLQHPLMLISMFLPFLRPLVMPLKLGFIDKKAKEFFCNITNQALDARIKEQDSTRVDFLQLMANAQSEEDRGDKGKRSMTRQEIISQALLFFVAGYDTTATTISFLAYSLACNSDAQEKLIDEIRRVVGDKENIDDDDLHQMPYLDMCVSESLRLFPPGVRTDRIAHKDVELKGIHIPAGCFVMVPIYHMHHFAEIYPDPEAFIPER